MPSRCGEIILMLFARIKGTEKQSCLQNARAHGLVHLPSEQPTVMDRKYPISAITVKHLFLFIAQDVL